jgi:hypothetical protein
LRRDRAVGRTVGGLPLNPIEQSLELELVENGRPSSEARSRKAWGLDVALDDTNAAIG